MRKVYDVGLKLSATAAVAAIMLHQRNNNSLLSVTRNEAANEDQNNNDNKPKTSRSSSSSETFDIYTNWMHDLKHNSLNFLNDKILTSSQQPKETKLSSKEEEEEEDKIPIKDKLKNFFSTKESLKTETKAEPTETNYIYTMTKSFTSLVSGEASENSFRELIHHARNRTQTDASSEESRSFKELMNLLKFNLEKVAISLEKNFGDLDINFFDPSSAFYYLEKEDEKKNPSWKRRMHRFHQGVNVQDVHELNEALKLAELSYADSIEEIRDGLTSHELIYCQMESMPGKPSHFLAVKRGQSIFSRSLEVLMVVRGTKNIADMLTDALLDAADYRGGKAHAGIMSSGKYLVERHSSAMESLLKVSKKNQIKLTIVGHSLGAGAGTIAGIEFHDDPRYDVSVVGFGCPAILSEQLSESTKDFVTTVIGDSDIVPRMSAASVGNVVLNILEYDWTSYARRDLQHALNEVIVQNTFIPLSTNIANNVMKVVDDKIFEFIKLGIKDPTNLRLQPILYPPGRCIHFYRDGCGISGTFTPATFFNEIDITRTMVDDHVISGYRRIFLEVMRNFHHDEHFSFDQIKNSKQN